VAGWVPVRPAVVLAGPTCNLRPSAVTARLLGSSGISAAIARFSPARIQITQWHPVANRNLEVGNCALHPAIGARAPCPRARTAFPRDDRWGPRRASPLGLPVARAHWPQALPMPAPALIPYAALVLYRFIYQFPHKILQDVNIVCRNRAAQGGRPTPPRSTHHPVKTPFWRISFGPQEIRYEIG
jgi:hypothetical protein